MNNDSPSSKPQRTLTGTYLRASGNTTLDNGKNKYFIGIDPGVNTGVAVWSKKEKKILKLLTLNFWTVIDFLETFEASMQAQDWGSLGVPVQPEQIQFEVVIEDPNMNKAMYKDRLVGKQILEAMKQAQNVGGNKKEAQLLIQWLEKKKIPFRAIRPVNRNSGGGKWNHEYFVKMTGWAGTSNEHTRDASRFVVGL